MIGPGKYETETSIVRELTRARGVVLMVIDGHRGSGFSAQLPPELLASLPAALREVADQIEADARKVGN